MRAAVHPPPPPPTTSTHHTVLSVGSDQFYGDGGGDSNDSGGESAFGGTAAARPYPPRPGAPRQRHPSPTNRGGGGGGSSAGGGGGANAAIGGLFPHEGRGRSQHRRRDGSGSSSPSRSRSRSGGRQPFLGGAGVGAGAGALSYLSDGGGAWPRGWRALVPSRLDREIALNALAVAGASMADPLMSMVDTAMVGRLGTQQLAALASNGALFNCVYFLFFTALAVLTTQLLAGAHARGDRAAAGRGFAQALAATAAVGLALAAGLASAPRLVLGAFATSPEVMADAATYLRIRALSVPAALFICVGQAAFRSLLDLRTPLVVVALSSVANLVLDELFMFAGGDSASSGGGNSGSGSGSSGASSAFGSAALGGGIAGCGWASVASQYLGAAALAVLIARRPEFGLREALDGAGDAAAAGGGGSSMAGAGGGGGGGGLHIDRERHCSSAELDRTERGGGGGGDTNRSPLRSRGGGGGGAGAGGGSFTTTNSGGGGGKGAFSPARGLQQQHSRGGGGSNRSHHYHHHHPGSAALPLRSKVWRLIRTLHWRPFVRRFAALSVRGCLILATYTTASVVAARAGAPAVIAAHQVVSQHQQLQISVAWAFLHVAQSMVAYVHASPAGPRAAARLAARIAGLALAYCCLATAATRALRGPLPKLFTRDPEVLALVRAAAAPAGAFLLLSWNSCLEGILLALDDAAFVVRVYPAAAAAALLQLIRTGLRPLPPAAALRGVWAGLAYYYLVLTAGFAARCAWRRRRRRPLKGREAGGGGSAAGK